MPAPARVRKRDGRLEPFDLAKLTRSLFAARREHAPARAALHAAELARAAAHFVALDGLDPAPTADIRRQVLAALTEFGHPETARRYAAGPARRTASAPPRPQAFPADVRLLAREGCLRLGVGPRPWRQAWTTVNAAPWSAGDAEGFLQQARADLLDARRRARRIVLQRLDLAAAATLVPPRRLGERIGLLLAPLGPRLVVRLRPCPHAAVWAELDGGPLFGPPPDADARLDDFHHGLAAALGLLEPAQAWLPLMEGALPDHDGWNDALRRGVRIAARHAPRTETSDGLLAMRLSAPAAGEGAALALAEAAMRGAAAFREVLRRRLRGTLPESAALVLADATGEAAAAARWGSLARRSAAALRLPLAPEPVPTLAAYAGRTAARVACRTLAELGRRRPPVGAVMVARGATGGDPPG